MKRHPTIGDVLKKHWLLIGILCCIFLAGLHPEFGSKKGPLNTDVTVKYGAVSLIFLISGLQMNTETFSRTFRNYRLHLFIQFFTFLFIPVFVRILIIFLSIFHLNGWVLKGLITVSCMPPPVSSAVILARAANGNETAAIFNSVIGSFLGIILTPLLLLLSLGSTAIVPLLATIIQLSSTVLIPLAIGQFIRHTIDYRRHLSTLNIISQSALLFVIYTTFCDSFMTSEIGLEALDVILTVFIIVCLQMALMAFSFNLALRMSIRRKRCFNIEDVVAIVFCSTHKSLTLGIPILRIMFQGYSHLSQISLPLLIYHPTQIILGGLIVAQLKDRVKFERLKRPPI